MAKSIKVDETVYALLTEEGRYGETFSQIIHRLILEARQNRGKRKRRAP